MDRRKSCAEHRILRPCGSGDEATRGPAAHTHDFDEVIGFLGTDPDDPGALGAVTFEVEGQTVAFDRSCVIYIPRGMRHSPILVPALERPIIHFTGGSGGDYATK